jgi:predicted metal-dependent phosphoesterase TrpH
VGWLDLHLHSNISNAGDYSPEELIALCHQAGLKVVALTDHNSVRGVSEAILYGNQYDIEVISYQVECRFSSRQAID